MALTNILQDICDRGENRYRQGILLNIWSSCFRIVFLSFADKKVAEGYVPILVFSCRLCTAFLVQLLLQMLILPTVPSQTHFLPPSVFSLWWLVPILVIFLSTSKCYCCGFLTQSAFLPVMLSSCLLFSLPSGFRSQIRSSSLSSFCSSHLLFLVFVLQVFPQCGPAYHLVIPFFASYVCFGNSTWKTCAQI